MPEDQSTLLIPEWVIDSSKPARGVDLLGLRIQAQRVSNDLLNGITTISPRIRYLSFRAWVIFKYFSLNLPDEWKSFIEFDSRMEAAFVIGNLQVNPNETQLAGNDKAGEKIAQNSDEITLERLVKQLAYQAYSGPSQQLLIDSDERNSGIPTLNEDRGNKLAEIINGLLINSTFINNLHTNSYKNTFSKEELEELGNILKIGNLDDKERDLLIDIVIPSNPQKTNRYDDLPRIKSYCLLLWIAQSTQKMIDEDAIFKFVSNTSSELPEILQNTRLGWLTYLTSDMFSVVSEAALELIKDVINTDNELKHPVNYNIVLNNIINNENLINNTFLDFKIISKNESYKDLGFNELYSRVQGLLGILNNIKGINLWESEINELNIISLAKSKDFQIASLLPLSLLITHFRFKDVGFDTKNEIINEIKTGFNEPNYHDFIKTKINEWISNNTGLQEVIAYLLNYVIELHNRIVWSRLAFDTKRNTVIVLKDNDEWRTTENKFRGGRTQSRLKQAIGWLSELSLLDSHGITELGENVLRNRIELIEGKENQ